MRTLALAAFFISVVSFSSLVLAQGTQLTEGTAGFEVTPVILNDIPFEEGQYCGNPNDPQTLNFKLALVGDPDFLNVRWDVRDPGGVERQIGTDCWLNCPRTSEEVLASGPGASNVCNGYQTCSFTGPTGDHACSIQQPVYNFDSDNTVVCRFYDVIDPSQGLVAPNRTFKTVDFEVNVPPITVTVGAQVNLPVTVKSFGILPNSFTNNFTALNKQQLVNVKNGVGETDTAICGEVVQTFPSLFFLAADSVPFSILTHTSVDTTTCSSNLDCGYLGQQAQCVQGVCWGRNDVTIVAELSSLPEYNIFGFVLIILVSSTVFFLARRKQAF